MGSNAIRQNRIILKKDSLTEEKRDADKNTISRLQTLTKL